MTRTTKTVGAVVLAIGLVLGVREGMRYLDAHSEVPVTRAAGPMVNPSPQFLKESRPFKVPAATVPARGLSAEKRAQLEKIRRDYEEIRNKMSQDYGAAGQKFPGGVKAFLRQLALIEREMHTDFAKALTPEELEDYEMAESNTGKAVQQRTADLALTDEQKRAVYRVQREFDDRFGLTFDVTPAALLERMKAQLVAREKIRGTLRDEIFAKWLRAEDPAYFAMRTLVTERGLPASAATELWRIKDDWTQRKLEIASQAGLTSEQRQRMQAALGEQIRSRVTVLVGDEAVRAGGDALGWLPPG